MINKKESLLLCLSIDWSQAHKELALPNSSSKAIFGRILDQLYGMADTLIIVDNELYLAMRGDLLILRSIAILLKYPD